MHCYSAPTAAAALGGINREFARLEKKAKHLRKLWEEGKISGICARGGFEVEINWNDGELTEAVITSTNGGRCNLRYAGSTLSFNTKKGGTYKVVLKNGKLRKA